ncbi:MAG: hypothetical protein A2383_00605 [Candidatus Pacebacteria bacterium RIFOXYB1_FULL_39_46]|nr:MAG: hypothetical protein A2182_00435 [Candidatus Pacebacteria bacterium RIFOXYA1_FULL_38_18]OGJ38088.1 MAG: hypothetical protein A2383_00605 [Candidatus Pacebacteria bacterium RIFOXYB1_FULL_39_46]OGJ39689.1 MAG: hypothetical protein A2411_02840 [Candidatus Pacebacteria bacterium RIFOXYC1_FULL_39_21]OGJ39840.1 MAG: hypothetical protein A2582_00370 [Candidatus Pacebacteria bacterium RIFOXYD1_FULL_39_27]
MKRKIYITLAIIGLLVAGYIYFFKNNSLANNPSLPIEIDALQGNISQQFAIMSSRAQEIGTQAKNVLGTSIQVDESSPSIQQKAIDYGQYLYCKQVVDSYEAR